MKNRFALQLLFFVLAAGFGTGAFAAFDDGGYMGIQYAMIEEDELELEPTAGVLRLGALSDEGFGFEARLGLGISSDDRTESLPFPFGETSLDLEIDYLLGLYILAQAPIGSGSIYGIVGFTHTEFTLEAKSEFLGSDSESDDESDLSFGFGVNFGVSQQVKLNIEFMQYLDTDDADASAISVGLLF